MTLVRLISVAAIAVLIYGCVSVNAPLEPSATPGGPTSPASLEPGASALPTIGPASLAPQTAPATDPAMTTAPTTSEPTATPTATPTPTPTPTAPATPRPSRIRYFQPTSLGDGPPYHVDCNVEPEPFQVEP